MKKRKEKEKPIKKKKKKEKKKKKYSNMKSIFRLCGILIIFRKENVKKF